MMNRTNSSKQKNVILILLAMMLSVFCVLKVIRGSDMGNTGAGGIWNYISLMYYLVFFIVCVTKSGFRFNCIFVSSIAYVFFALLATILNWNLKIDISSVYNFLMIPYPIIVMCVFFLTAHTSKWYERIILFGYALCLFLNLRSVVNSSFADAEEAMKSDIYFSLGMFPFALQFLKQRYIRTVVIILQFVAVFLSDKRTALIAFVIGLVMYALISAVTKDGNAFIGTVKNLMLVTVAIVLFYNVGKYIDNMFNLNIFNRLLRLSEDGGSGRDDIYENVWNAFKNSNLAEKMFGHGMNTAGMVGGAGKAHNDFLQIIYDYGVFAIVSIAVFYVSIVVSAFKMIRKKSPYAASFAFSVVIGLFLAMFSYFIVYFTYVTCIMAFWGYTLAMNKQCEEKEEGISEY